MCGLIGMYKQSRISLIAMPDVLHAEQHEFYAGESDT